MTLNVTVLTKRSIHQCADYRFTNWQTGTWEDLGAHQKVQLVNKSRWHATVCFNGVGRSRDVNVSAWLAQCCATLAYGAPFDDFIANLRTADKWLATIPLQHRRHSFVVGAIVENAPLYALVSNYERLSGAVLDMPDDTLSVFVERPKQPKTIVCGQRQAVDRETRWRLAALASLDGPPDRMSNALAEVNRRAAASNKAISKGCFTSYVLRSGDGGGQVHDMEVGPAATGLAAPELQGVIEKLLKEQFGERGGRLVSMVTARSEPTAEYHEVRLRDKPNDPSTHLNYGVFLMKAHDLDGAEQAYRRALELDPKYALAFGNLAIVYERRGTDDEALRLHERAYELKPKQENIAFNFARFLLRTHGDRARVRAVLTSGIEGNPSGTRSLVLLARLDIEDRRYRDAIDELLRAREQRGNQAEIEPLLACAIHMNGAPVEECIAAYRTAIAVAPSDSGIRLNLAQLLFASRTSSEAIRLLRDAEQLGLSDDASLEAQFYLLAHGGRDGAEVSDRILSLKERGARLRWDVRRNIEFVRQQDAAKAELLERLARTLEDENGVESLRGLLQALASGEREAT